MGGLSGEQVFDNFKQGEGTSSLQLIATELLKLQKTYGKRAEAIEGIQRSMESAWSGDAGTRARQGAGPLMPALEESARNMDSTVGSMKTQAGDWHTAANSVEPVPPLPEKPNPWTTGLKAAIPVAGPFMASSDLRSYQDGVEAHNRAAQHNVDVMSAYSNQTSSNSNFPRTYGVLEPGSSPISVASSSTPSAISGDLHSDVTRSSTVSAPAGTGTPVTSGPMTSAVPQVGSPVSTGAGTPTTTPGPITSGPAGSTGPTGPTTGLAAAGPVTPPPGSSSGDRARPGSTPPGRSTFGTTNPTKPGAPRGLSERAGSRLYSPGGGSSGGTVGRGGAGGVGGVGSGGSAGDAASRALGAGKGTGAGLPGGAASAAESAAARSAAGTRGAGMGAMGAAGAGGARREEDEEHQRAAYLQENDPDEVFIGDLGKTTPPVIGE
ncbi:hypothetical protein [Prauserella flavalba]|uniref:hypothetical protein n=1 Tax=Prauserella flavalba TaxID=1477506 RepID=UPI000D7609DC|nr:hypothetical protein [Prauserella flavalba]